MKVKVMKYYLMDWDDNVMYMPTKIHLQDDEGEVVDMSTHDFAHYRNFIDSKTGKSKDPSGFEYDGKNIVGLAPNAFEDFSSDSTKFISDVQKAEIGPAWGDFVEALNSASLFGIITARGHSPETLKDGVKYLISTQTDGISIEKMIQSLRKRKMKANEEYMGDKVEIQKYLDMCLFYPVAYFNKGGSLKPEEVKRDAIIKYKKEIENMVDSLNKKMMEKGESAYILKPVFGFSDDDLKNVEYSSTIPGVNIYSTHGGKKKLHKKGDEEKINEQITKILKLIKF